MDFILQYKEDIIKLSVVLLPILSMLIPKLFSDIRTRNLLGSIELGADLKANAYTQIIAELVDVRSKLEKMTEGEILFDDIKETFKGILEDISVLEDVKEEINMVKSQMVKTIEAVQELLLATHDSINVKAVIEQQNEEIKELKNEISKLNNRFGGR